MNEASKLKQFAWGMYAGVPVILGFIPVGIAYAIMARQAGFTVGETILMSASVFAGASQMMSVGMYASGASIAAIVFATFLLNLRHIIMATCVADRMKPCPRWLRFIAGFGVTDEGFAVFCNTQKYKCTVIFYMGLALVTYLSWVAGTAIGAVASDILPPIVTAALGVSLYAMFIGILVPGIKKNVSLIVLVGITAVLNSILSCVFDSGVSLVISTLVCAFAGMFFVKLPDEEEAKK